MTHDLAVAELLFLASVLALGLISLITLYFNR